MYKKDKFFYEVEVIIITWIKGFGRRWKSGFGRHCNIMKPCRFIMSYALFSRHALFNNNNNPCTDFDFFFLIDTLIIISFYITRFRHSFVFAQSVKDHIPFSMDGWFKIHSLVCSGNKKCKLTCNVGQIRKKLSQN